MPNKSERSFSQRKLPHPGISGRIKGQPHNEYQEIKGKLNLTVTQTAKDLFRGLSEKYGLPISKIIEIIARSPEILSKIESILKVESEKIEKLRAKSKKNK